MNWRHVQAFVWLRWRLLTNQWRRAGPVNAALMMVVTVGAIVTAIPTFIGCLLLGLYAIPDAAPVHLLYAWDALVVVFLFFWLIGLIADLQRSEPLSLAKFLHLPVSVDGAFLINYLSSLLRLSLIALGPVMLAFCLALVITKGVALLPVLPLTAAFVLMISALTYQFQGWLASLMSNPRRRRSVIVATTALFILVFQLPNLINILAPWGASQRRRHGERSAALTRELAELDRTYRSRKIGPAEYTRKCQEVVKGHELAAQLENRETARHLERIARTVNLILPVGWLPLGVTAAAEGDVVRPLLALGGMTLIGTASLAMAYRATVRQYQGQSTAREGRKAAGPSSSAHKPGALLLEARIPGVSEPVSAVALGGFRSLVRAPEAKMILLSPIIMLSIFGSLILRGRADMPEAARPLVAIGGMVCMLFGMMQLMGNQFGFDRDGFRVLILSAARRRDILLGKNLAIAPMVLAMATILLPTVQVVFPMRADHLLAMLPQYLSMFLLLCPVTNLFSIYTPIHIAAGALKASNPKFSTVLLQLVLFLLLFPLAQGLTLIPLGIESLLLILGWIDRAPVFLALALLECAGVVLFYRLSLGWLGDALQAREQAILEVVTNRAS